MENPPRIQECTVDVCFGGRVIFVASEIPIGSQRLGSKLPNVIPHATSL